MRKKFAVENYFLKKAFTPIKSDNKNLLLRNQSLIHKIRLFFLLNCSTTLFWNFALLQQFIIILFKSLAKHYMQYFGSRCLRHFNESYSYSVYFLKGNDPRPLNLSQQNEIYTLIKDTNFNSSALLYNSK